MCYIIRVQIVLTYTILLADGEFSKYCRSIYSVPLSKESILPAVLEMTVLNYFAYFKNDCCFVYIISSLIFKLPFASGPMMKYAGIL